MQRIFPKTHLPVKLWSGVKGTEKKHMRMSEAAKFRMKKLVTVCMCRERITAADTKMLPNVPRLKKQSGKN